jgi:hypothetical protein
MAGTTYFSWTMIRRLLACLALVSGLAAAGAPAHASLIEALEQLEVAGEKDEKATKETCTCEERQQEQRRRGQRVHPCAEERPVRIYLPVVMFGADRALE